MLKDLFLLIQNLISKERVLSFDYFNSQLNNLDDMDREQPFYLHKAIFWNN